MTTLAQPPVIAADRPPERWAAIWAASDAAAAERGWPPESWPLP